MAKKLSGPLTETFQKDDIVCRAGDHDTHLYKIHSGKLLVFVIKGTQVTPLAILKGGEYFGEFSFFDTMPRSANVVCLEESTLIHIPISELDKQFPDWLINVARSITSEIRSLDEMIRMKGIRRKNVETVKPLSIEEQRHYFSLI